MEIGVALGKDKFSRTSRYDALFLSYDTFVPALRGLIALGYVEETRKGFNDPRTGIGRVTRVRATPKLVALLTGAAMNLAKVSHRTDGSEIIVLRGNDKEDVEYRDNELTRQMRSELERINRTLSAHWLDLFISDTEMMRLNAKMAGRHEKDERVPQRIDLTARRLRRIFNNRDWNQGGRFYGGWWQTIPKEYRTHITIDGKHTVEIDYSGMHPVLLYAEAGIKLDTELDVYNIGKPNVPRHIIKRAFNKLVNASGRTVATPDFDEQQFGLSWSELVKLVREKNEPIAQFLAAGHGLHLQSKDAKIANRIMLRFLDRGYVCLPVHDSFIVHHGLQNELEQIMRDEFRAAVGTDVAMKTKFDVISAGVFYKDDDTDLANPLGSLSGKFAGHEVRVANWFSSRGS